MEKVGLEAEFSDLIAELDTTLGLCRALSDYFKSLELI